MPYEAAWGIPLLIMFLAVPLTIRGARGLTLLLVGVGFPGALCAGPLRRLLVLVQKRSGRLALRVFSLLVYAVWAGVRVAALVGMWAGRHSLAL